MNPTPTQPQQQQQHPYNPYATLPGARHTNEPIPHFLQRLPPAQAAPSTPPPGQLPPPPPWYWIANPHRSAYGPTGGAEPGDVASLTRDGLALLQDFRVNVAQRGRNSPELREVLRGGICAVAQRAGVTCGKWLLFPQVHEVNEVWRRVCEGVDANRLGTAAKVSTSSLPGGSARVVCVYTKDFTDVEDVRRVLLALVDMGLVEVGGIRYKCDAYTYLGIYGRNEYELSGGIYSSNEMLAGGSVDVVMEDVAY